MYLDYISPDHVEYKVGPNNQYAVSVLSEFEVTRGATQQGISLKEANAILDIGNELFCANGAIFSYVIENGNQIVLSGGQITENMPSAHESELGASPSSFCV